MNKNTYIRKHTNSDIIKNEQNMKIIFTIENEMKIQLESKIKVDEYNRTNRKTKI